MGTNIEGKVVRTASIVTALGAPTKDLIVLKSIQMMPCSQNQY